MSGENGLHMICPHLDENEKFFLGNSMLPTIQTGAKLRFQELAPSQIYPGDIVLFSLGKKVFCHRIVGKYTVKKKLYFLERGDNPSYGKVRVLNADRIIGKVVRIETKDKEILSEETFRISRRLYFFQMLIGAVAGVAHNLKLIFFGSRQSRISSILRRTFFRILNRLPV